MRVTHTTRFNRLIGYPLEHSQSPVLHAAVYRRLGIDAVLVAQPHAPLRSLIQAVKTQSVALTAVTSPYKAKVMKFIDHCSSEVSVLNAVNTLIQSDGKLQGYNTDIDGIAFALRDIAIPHQHVAVIGAGGAARALGYFLQKNQAKILWINRTRQKARTLAKAFGGEVIAYDELQARPVDFLVNATPVGLYPHVDSSPLPGYTFSAHQVVFDMVYNPMMTPLLKQAKKYKATIISGLDMFIGQGLKQIALLTGQTIPTLTFADELRKILIQNQRAMRT